jgi:tripartite-type tricarboxylate transporter receptor subunit TctC
MGGMIATRRALLATPLLALPLPTRAAWPERPLRLVVPFAAGGATDLTARALAEALAPRLGQPVVVENLSGAGGNVGAEAVARARPDGHTLLFSTPGPLAINAFLYPRLPFDPETAFAPVALAVRVANVAMVPAALPVASLAELVALAKARPGALSYASAGVGSTSHLAAELLKAEAGIALEHVPYRGTGPALADLVAGRVQLQIDGVPAGLPQIRAGAVRPLAVTSATRWFALPEVPTVAEAGLPGTEATAWGAVVAPAGLPGEIAARLAALVTGALRRPEVTARMQTLGAEVAGGTPEELAAHVLAERRKWRAVVARSGARLEG